MPDAAPLNGRRQQAARNDGLILDAARAVFLADPGAPIADVAARAGVGISALYRRYDGKEGLLRALAEDALNRYLVDLRQALDELGVRRSSAARAWTVYADCLGRVVDGRSQALAQRLAGSFRTTPQLSALAVEVGTALAELHDRVQRAGALRRDVSPADVTLLLEAVMIIEVPHDELRRRYLALLLQSLRAPGDGGLPGEPAADRDLAARWRRADG